MEESMNGAKELIGCWDIAVSRPYKEEIVDLVRNLRKELRL